MGELYADPTREEAHRARQAEEGVNTVEMQQMQGFALAQFCLMFAQEMRHDLDFSHEDVMRLLCAALSGR